MPLALFDLDNTLIDRQAAYRRWAEGFVAHNKLTGDALDWLCVADADGFADRDDVFVEARQRFGLTESVAELVATYRQEYPTFYRPDDEINTALVRLRRAGWRIGVVTNGPPSQHEKVERAGLGPLIDACCVSEELGLAKPDLGIFTEAIRAAGGLPPPGEPAWMVGDAPGPDIGGGRAAGLQTAWIHRNRPWERTDYRPDAIVATVPEAVALLLYD